MVYQVIKENYGYLMKNCEDSLRIKKNKIKTCDIYVVELNKDTVNRKPRHGYRFDKNGRIEEYIDYIYHDSIRFKYFPGNRISEVTEKSVYGDSVATAKSIYQYRFIKDSCYYLFVIQSAKNDTTTYYYKNNNLTKEYWNSFIKDTVFYNLKLYNHKIIEEDRTCADTNVLSWNIKYNYNSTGNLIKKIGYYKHGDKLEDVQFVDREITYDTLGRINSESYMEDEYMAENKYYYDEKNNLIECRNYLHDDIGYDYPRYIYYYEYTYY